MTRTATALPDGPELLTFSEAAKLSGQPKAYLRELAECGRLAVRMVPGEGESKLRLTRAALAEAGLFPQAITSTQAEHHELTELIALVREQSTRIAALEEQRFQLGAQLGIAVERVASLENQVSQLSGVQVSAEPALPAHTGEVIESHRGALGSLTQAGLQRTGEFRQRITGSRFLPARFRNGHRSQSEGFGI